MPYKYTIPPYKYTIPPYKYTILPYKYIMYVFIIAEMRDYAYASGYLNNVFTVITYDGKVCIKKCYDMMKTDRNVHAATIAWYRPSITSAYQPKCYCMHKDHIKKRSGNSINHYGHLHRT